MTGTDRTEPFVNADRNEIDFEIKRIGKLGEKAFKLSSIDKIGDMITRGIVVMDFLMESEVDSEKLDLACKSLETEQRLIPTWDSNRFDPLRNCVYSMCECLRISVESIVANMKNMPTAAVKAKPLQAESKRADIRDNGGSGKFQTAKTETIPPRVIAVKAKKGLSERSDNHNSLIVGAHRSNEQHRRFNERIDRVAHNSSDTSLPKPVEINKEPINTIVTSKRTLAHYFSRPRNSSTTHAANEVAKPPQAKKARDENEREIKEELICLPNSTSADFPSTTSTNNVDSVYLDAKFSSFEEFRVAMDHWMSRTYQLFRIASSEKLNHCEPTVNDRDGQRPNQNYLPCGCTATIRINYCHTEKCLKITTFKIEHSNHAISPRSFAELQKKLKTKHRNH